MGVGGDGGAFPGGIEEGGLEVEDVELLFAALVVANVAVEDFGIAAMLALGEADEEENGDGAAAAGAKGLAALSAGNLALGVLVAAEVVDVDMVKLGLEALAEAGSGVGVKPAAVGDIGDYPPRCPKRSVDQRKALM